MIVSESGFILYVINYDDCVEFYKKVLELPILYIKDGITCFDFHGPYLMIERTDEPIDDPGQRRDRSCLRINVDNVQKWCAALDKHNVPYNYSEFQWGTIAKFRDPDGNLLGFRSAVEHISDKLNYPE